MEIRLPKEYDSDKIADLLSKILTELEGKAIDQKMPEMNAALGKKSPDINIGTLHLQRDGETREVVFKDKGQVFFITATKR